MITYTYEVTITFKLMNTFDAPKKAITTTVTSKAKASKDDLQKLVDDEFKEITMDGLRRKVYEPKIVSTKQKRLYN